jgi:flavin reductase (DIM6/NTAB) family NADH-FMN oxidoreductase RutF
MKELSLSKVYQLLEPGPVVLLTTLRKGHANIMTMSWHMMVEFTPPLIACVLSNANYSFAALRATRQCVIAIPALELAPKVVGIGNCSGRDVDKFKRFGLTPAAWRRLWWRIEWVQPSHIRTTVPPHGEKDAACYHDNEIV